MSLTKKDIISILKDKNISVEDFAYGDFGEAVFESGTNKRIYSKSFVDGLGEIEEVDQRGGEDMGSDWYSIKFLHEHDMYLKVQGYYQSYNGTEFYDGYDCISIVSPKLVTITVYE